jgi:hypothetical protein
MKAHKFVIGGSSSDTVTVFCEHCGIVAPNCVLMRQMTMAEIDRERARINSGCPLAPESTNDGDGDKMASERISRKEALEISRKILLDAERKRYGIVIQEAEEDEGDKIIADASAIIMENGDIDGVHHKTWVIDRVLRKLLGEDKYNKFVASCNGNWDEGIAP